MSDPVKVNTASPYRQVLTEVPPAEPKPDPWFCPTCGKIEPLLLPIGIYTRRSCACEREAARREKERLDRKKRLQAMARRTYGGWLSEQYVDINLARATFANVQIDKQPNIEDRKRLIIAKKAAEGFAANPRGIFVLYGPCGLAKTTLLACIINTLRRERETPMPSLFMTPPQWFHIYYDRMERHDNEWMLVDQAISTPFLVIDDITKATPKPFRQDVFFEIIDARVRMKKPIGISTNDMEEMARYIGDAAYSRLQVGLQSFQLSGRDYRTLLSGKEKQ